jgi:hypothetical protein
MRGKSRDALRRDGVVGRDKAKNFPEAVKCPRKLNAIEEDETERWLTLVRFSVFGPRQYTHACLVCSAYKCSHQKENNTSSDQPMRL